MDIQKLVFQLEENGESRINIPVNVPEGTILTPKLSINYNSQGGDGILGKGFSLSGLYSITRVSATLEQDGFIGGVDFDDHDRFALNGERLMVVQGDYGQNNSEYRTEQNSFSKVISYGSVGGGPEKFKMWTKDGLIMEFGFTTDSRIEAQGKSSALIWLVNRIQDRKGNYITIEYEEDQTNSEYRPKEILYTGNINAGLQPYNSIKFIYETRPDTIPKFLNGSKVFISKRLTRIEAYDHDNVYRSYNIEYLSQSVASKVEMITECGSDGTCFSPTEFTWGQLQQDWDVPSSGPVQGEWLAGAYPEFEPASGHIYPLDMNADGLQDFLLGPASNGSWYVLKNTGSEFIDEGPWITNVYGHWSGAYDRVRPMDVNGDNLPDIVMGPDGGGCWYVLRNTGSSLVDDGPWLCGAFGSPWDGHGNPSRIRPMDVNADGLSDIVIGPDGHGNWYVLKNTGSSFTNEGAWGRSSSDKSSKS